MTIDKKRVDLKIKRLKRSCVAFDRAPLDIKEFIADSVVERYKIVIELLWKSLGAYMEEQGMDIIGTPREILQAAHAANLLSQHELDEFLHYVKLRTNTPEMYNKKSYQTVIEATPKALLFAEKLIARLNTE